MKIIEIEGVGATYAAKLEATGIATDIELLERGGTRKGRADKGLVRRPPSEGMIADWIVEAGTLGRARSSTERLPFLARDASPGRPSRSSRTGRG